ncbi:MAG: SemiSWEET transporter [Pseudomonadota bacterium]|nr:SemiSWEET transporter [Pseudomonadota bacterium]
MSTITLIGFVAASLTTAAFVPQALRAWRTRQTRDLSLTTFGILVTGVALWLVYGLLIGDAPLIISNAITLCVAASLVFLKLRHG